MSKLAELARLARQRAKAPWPGYKGIAEYHQGAYECLRHVSPYTKTAGNVDAKIFVMLQDWSSDRSLSGPLDDYAKLLGFTPSEATNRNLARLLARYFRVALFDVYATNLFPFVKPGSVSDRIPAADLKRAAIEFAIPQVKIVKPSLVICLGLDTFNAVRRACDLGNVDNITEAAKSVFPLSGAEVWCQAHTGARGQATRGADRVEADWHRMAKDFAARAFPRQSDTADSAAL